MRGLQFDPSGGQLARSIAVRVAAVPVVIAVGKRAWGLVRRKQESSGRGLAILVLVLIKVFDLCEISLLFVESRSSIRYRSQATHAIDMITGW